MSRVGNIQIIILILLVFFYVLMFSAPVFAQPKTKVQYKRNAENLAEVQVTNNTLDPLVCYVAIDGHKVHFRLQANQKSVWYKATDSRFNYYHFSTWCDYALLYDAK